MGRDFPQRLELSFTKPENVANQDILTPKIIAVIPFGVQARAEAMDHFAKQARSLRMPLAFLRADLFCLVEDLPGVASPQRALSHMLALKPYWRNPSYEILERAMGTSVSLSGRSAPSRYSDRCSRMTTFPAVSTVSTNIDSLIVKLK